MNEVVDMQAFYLKPHKSFDKIEEEYKIKFSREEIEKLTELVSDFVTKKEKLKELLGFLAEIGQNKRLKGKILGYFMYDVLRTSTFYVTAAMTIDKVLEESEKKKE